MKTFPDGYQKKETSMKYKDMNEKVQKNIEKYPIPWSKDHIQKFRTQLLDWYDKQGRNLPWRASKDPYKIWVSEIMLQQTQVETVKPYFERFISELPRVQDLADASEPVLMKLWQGLGYYSRVRNMHTAAKQIMTEFGGEFPTKKSQLLTLKGIGPYTSGAIASMAFDEVEPAIDGNLTRIVTRLFDIPEDIQTSAVKQQIEAYLYQLIDPGRPGDFNQALMDMGAMIMTATNPYPESHPLAEFDASYHAHTSHLRPVKTKKSKATHHQWLAYIIQNNQGEILMRKHTDNELLTGLWHFPLVEIDMMMEGATKSELVEPFIHTYGKYLADYRPEEFELIQSPQDLAQEAEIKHIFSHRVWYIKKVQIQSNSEEWMLDSHQFMWVPMEQLQTLPMSTLQIKLMS